MLLPLITGEARHCFWPFHLQGQGRREGEGEGASDPTHHINPTNAITLHRGVDTALHRSVCDFCSSTIFGGYYFCKKCGRDYCLQCERYFPDSMEAVGESPWELTDAARPRLLKCIKQPWEEMMNGGGGEIGKNDSIISGNGNGSARTNSNTNTNGERNDGSAGKSGRRREKAIAWHVRGDLQPVSRFTKEEIESHWLSLAEFVIGHGFGPDAGSSFGFGFLFGASAGDKGDGDEPERVKKEEERSLQREGMLRVMGLQMDEEVKRVLEQWRKEIRVVREKEGEKERSLVAHFETNTSIESNPKTNTNLHSVSNPECSSDAVDSQASIEKTSSSIPGSAVTTTKDENKQEQKVDEVEDLEMGELNNAGEMSKDAMETEDEEQRLAVLTDPTAALNSVASASEIVRSPTPITSVKSPVATNVSSTTSSNSPQVNTLEKSSEPVTSTLTSIPTSNVSPKAASDPTPNQQQNLEQISFSYTKYTHPNPPSDPANLSDYSLPFIYLPSPEGLDNKAFDELWSKGEPIVVGGVNVHVGGGHGGQRRGEGEKMGREGEEWGPEKFIERFGEEQCSVVDCQTDTPLVSTVGAFFAAFGEKVSRPQVMEGMEEKRKEKKRQGILKLKVSSFSIGCRTGFQEQ